VKEKKKRGGEEPSVYPWRLKEVPATRGDDQKKAVWVVRESSPRHVAKRTNTGKRGEEGIIAMQLELSARHAGKRDKKDDLIFSCSQAFRSGMW